MQMIKMKTIFTLLVSMCASLFISCQPEFALVDPPVDPTDTISEQPQADTGLLAHYRFTGNANDSSGHNKHGVLMNGTGFTTDAHGRPGRAVDFDGIDDWIKVVDSTNYFAPAKMTVAFQFNLRDANTRSAFLSKSNFATPSGVVWGIGISRDVSPRLEYVTGSPGTDCAAIWGGNVPSNTLTHTIDLEPNEWYHAAITFDSGVQKLYINGVLAGNKAAGFLTQLQCAGADLKIGAWWQNDIVSVKGKMDELRIYGRVLSLAEIKVLAAELADLNRGLIAYYPFNGNTNDSSGNNKHGTAINGVGFGTNVANVASRAAEFDGLDDYINIPDSVNYFARDTMSVSFLVNLRNINTRSAFLTKAAFNTPSAVSWGSGIELDNTGKIGFTVGNATNSCTAVWNTSQGGGTQIRTVDPLENNKWMHVTLLYEKGIQKIFLNGQLQSTNTDPWGYLNQCNNANLRIGGWWKDDIISLNGKIDEIRFYNRILTAFEIALLTEQVL